MSDQFVAEIRIFPFNYAPVGWAFCDGQYVPISQNTALFALLGTIYGGDGKSTFGLPDLQGSAPMHPGQGKGLTLRDLGEVGGVEGIVLSESQMPVHTHGMTGDADDGGFKTPGITMAPAGGNAMYTDLTPNVTMASESLPQVGGNMPHSNLQPYLALNFCIALQGIFPERP